MLKDTLLKFLKIDGLIENLGGYVETRVELLKLEIKEEIAKSMSRLSLIFGVAIIFLIATTFISFGVAVYIGQWLDSLVAGCTIVGGLYLSLAVIILFYKDPIAHRLEKKIKEIVKHNKK
jgi:uncharacterized membrane protein YqjE